MALQQTEDNSIVLEKIVNTSVDKAFYAWSTLEELEQWWGPEGTSIKTYQFDFKLGGIWRFTMKASNGSKSKNRMKYKEIIKNKKIVFSNDYDKDNNPDEFDSIIIFDEVDEKTKLTLIAVFPSKNVRDTILANPMAMEGINATITRLIKRLESD